MNRSCGWRLRRNRNRKNLPLFDFLKEHMFLFSTYLIILFIPLAASIFYTANVDAIMRRDAYRYQNSVLQREKFFCDSILRSGKAAAAAMSTNIDTTRLSVTASLSPADRWRVYTLTRSLSNILQNNAYIDGLGIYFYKNDSFITNNGRYVPVLYGTYLAGYGLTLDTFLESASGFRGFFTARSGAETYFIIYQNIFDHSFLKRCAVSYAIIPWSNIRREAVYLDPTADEAFFLLTRETALFAGSAPPTFADQLPDYDTLKQAADMEGGFFRESAADASLFSAVASDELELYYGACLSKKEFYRDINRLSRIYGIGILLSLLTGTAAAFYFTRKNSAPLDYLLSLVNESDRKNTNIALSGSYRRLEEALIALQRNSQSLSRHLNEHRTTAFEATLAGFFKGIYPSEDWILDFHEREPHLCDIGDYQTVLFCFSNVESCKFIRAQQENLGSYSLLFFALKNVIDEAFLEKDEDEAGGVSIVMDGMVACILPARPNEEESSRLTARADTCIGFFRDLFELECCIAVSGRHSLWTELADSYEEAHMALTHAAFLKEDSALHFYRAGQENREPDGTGLLSLKKNLAGSLIVNNYALARELADEIMSTCFMRDIRYFAYNQCQLCSLSSLLLDKLSDMGMSDDAKIEYSEKLLSIRSTAELEEVAETIFAEIFHYRSLDVSDNDWAESVKAYIRENYSNPELNVAFIAERFDVSAAHIGNRFRKLTGLGILDYVHTVRLARCKELLEQGCTIKHCADATGYTDIKTLQRAFKRYEGITPGQYKEGSLKK